MWNLLKIKKILVTGSTFKKNLNNSYDSMMQCKKSLFILPRDVVLKGYAKKVTHPMKLRTHDKLLL